MQIGVTDDFERQYMAKLRAIASTYGIFVEYSIDRAARDIGLHFTQESADNKKIVVPSLAWFQMKGIMTDTLPLSEYKATNIVSVPLSTNHLRFWYVSPESTFLVIYIGSADEFLVINIKDWVAQNIGAEILSTDQKSFTVHVDKKNALDDQAFRLIMEHNLVPAIRDRIEKTDSNDVGAFLRASEVIKWLVDRTARGIRTKIEVRGYISKLRTEVRFLEFDAGSNDWVIARDHWQVMMPELSKAFPFLNFASRRLARFNIATVCDEHDGELHSEEIRTIEWLNRDDGDDDDFDDDEIDSEGWIHVGNDIYAYGDVMGGEWIIHEFDISLNELGQQWSALLTVFESTEIISVDTHPKWVSVAPWHARDL